MTEIRFKLGTLLDNAFIELKQSKDTPLDNPSREELTKILEERKETWSREGSEIIESMKSIMGLDFYLNAIDVYFVHAFGRAFSEPLTISFKYKGDLFVDILTHEIIHVLSEDNKQRVSGSSWVRQEYPDLKDRTLINHILIHAVHKEIYLNVLKSSPRLNRDKERCKLFPSYKMAWEIVERDGHISIIDKFRRSE